MAVVRCEQGHFYDDEKYSQCPHCSNPLLRSSRRDLDDQQTVFGAQLSEQAMRQHVQVNLNAPVRGLQDEKTVGVFHSQKGFSPVVAWLVCTAGGEKGRDYRLHGGRNFIGRDLQCDISLAEDLRISRENHCSIVFEPKQSTYTLVRGLGEGVLVDGNRLMESQALLGDEEITIGDSTFVFIPFCKGGRSW